MRARSWVLAAALASGGCGVVLGLEDKSPFPVDGGAGDSGGAAGDATVADAALADGSGDGNLDPCAKCGFTTCTGGNCQVFTLAKTDRTVDGNVENPLAVAVSKERVFWSTNHGSIYTCERNNCPATRKSIAVPAITPGYATEDKVYSLLADDTSVYWAQYYTGRLFRTGHDGGNVESMDGHGNVGAIVGDDQNLYWVNYGAGSSSLWRCKKTVCFSQPSATIFMTNPYVAQTKPDPECTEAESRCWFASSLADNVTSLAFVDSKIDRYGDIYSIAKTAVDSGVKAWSNAEHPFPLPTSVTAHNGTIYFSAEKAPIDKGVTIVQGNVTALTEQYNPNPIMLGVDDAPTALTTDGTDLFWYAFGTGEIHSCGIAGCGNKPKTLATNQPGAQSLVADGNTLYWVNSESVEVQMLVVR